MSYYANEEDDDVLVTPDHRVRRGSRKGSSKRRSSSKKSSRNTDKLIDHDLNDDVVDDDDEVVVVADDIVMVGSDEDRKSKRLQAKRQESRSKSRERRLRAKQGEDGRNSRILFSKRKSSKKKSRREQVYDDLYGTDYHEVDDGIVGCADALCVGNTDVFEDEAAKGAATKDVNNKKTLTSILPSFNSKSKTADNDTSLSSPNTGEQNKVDDSEEVYVVRQRYGYFSIFFGVIQIIVLGLMMWQCGIAPMNINPMFGPYPDALSEWGGKNSILIVEDGEWWRLFTPILLHAGVIHLLCNVAVQLELGVFFEREWGSMTWLTIYMTSALGSSVLSVITMPDAVSVGSSGAVMGLFGGKLAEIICRSCEKQDTAQDRVAHQVRKEQCLGVTCSVIVVLAFSFIPYVDWAAHLGGLLAGFFVGFMTFSFHLESYCYRLLWFSVGMALTLGFFIPCIDIMYSGDVPINEELRDVCGYYQQNFDDYECNCMRDEYLENLKNGNFFNYYNGDDDNGGDEEDADGGGERFLYQLAKYYGL